MPDITTLFEGTDGVSRTLFNQKLSDVNAHGNDGAMHVTEAERGKWNDGVITPAERTVWNGKAATATYTATLTAAGWSASAPYTQTVVISGLLATDNPIADVVLSETVATAQAQLEAWGCVGRMVADTNSCMAYCYDTKPTMAIPIQLKVVR